MVDQNLLVNGGFEQHSQIDDLIDRGSWFTAVEMLGWSATKGRLEVQKGEGVISGAPVDETGELSSGHVLELDSHDVSSSGNSGRAADSTVSQHFDVAEGGQFEFGFSYAARKSIETSGFEVLILDASGRLVFKRKFTEQADGLSMDWSRFTKTLDLKAGSYSLQFSSAGLSDNDKTGALIDNAFLYTSQDLPATPVTSDTPGSAGTDSDTNAEPTSDSDGSELNGPVGDMVANVDFSDEIASMLNMLEANSAFQIAFTQAMAELNADNKVSQLSSSGGK